MRNMCKRLLFCIAVALLSVIGTLKVQADNAAWMGGIPDNTFVSQLSIPGTHDAGTGHGVNNVYVIVSGSTYATTQEKTLTEQWNSGIRAFDLRPAVDGSRLRIYHGIVSTNLYLDDALSTLCGLLDSHPTEMCVVIIRHETEADNGDDSWGTKMKELLNKNPTKSHAANFNPDAKLGEMRGKLLILSRDTYNTNPIGGYISGWGFNPNFSNQQGGRITGVGTQGPLYVQDYYDVSASGAPVTKTSSIQRMLQFSCTENTHPGLWVINQTSGYSKTASVFGNTVSTSDGYRDNAATQNPFVISYINSQPGPTGIVLMDYAGEDVSNGYNVKGQALTNALIANNSKAGPHADYFRTLGVIVPGNDYVVTTSVEGTKYYLTSTGLLTADAANAGVFTFSRVEGATYTYGFQLLNSYFTNPPQTNGAVNYNTGRIRTDTSNKRKDWEAQVFFMNGFGKYAVRATNANGSGNWTEAAKAYWTVNSGTNGPVAEYSSSMNYVWNVEAAPPINVTYNIYFGGKKCGEVVVPSERNSTAELPEEYINDFCTYTYSPKTITGSTIRVTVRWGTGAPFKITSTTEYWYNLKVGRLARFVGWEDREPYHPHAYGKSSEENYPEEELYATELVRASDAYQWAFTGNPVEGFRIVNKLMGEEYCLTVDGAATSVQGVENVKNTVLRQGDFRWTVHANNDGFSLSLNGQENYYVNTHGGPHGYLQVWETANARTDLGSRLIAEAVPAPSVPLTPIGNGYYTTLCLPYDVTVGEAKVYVLKKGEDSGDDDTYRLPIIDRDLDGSKALAPAQYEVPEGYALLTMVRNTVSAGKPIVLWGESGTATLSYGRGFATVPSNDTGLCGLFLPNSPERALTLQDLDGMPGFYSFTGESIAPNQAYLCQKDSSVQAVLLKFSDIEDGIGATQSNKGKGTDDAWYDLGGRQVSTAEHQEQQSHGTNGTSTVQPSSLKKGIYIHNGRKVVIR